MSTTNSIAGILVSKYSIPSRLIKVLVLVLISIGMHQTELLAQTRQQFLEKRKAMSVDKRSRSYRNNVMPFNRLLNLNRGQCDFTVDSVRATGNPLSQIIQSLAGSGITISNITTNLPPSSSYYGSFSCGSAAKLGLESGLILTSGSVLNAKGPNSDKWKLRRKLPRSSWL